MQFKMEDNQVITEINGCVRTGKEACVFHAGGGRSECLSLMTQYSHYIMLEDYLHVLARISQPNPLVSQ
jgi:serine/threonine-protein kinase RIO1